MFLTQLVRLKASDPGTIFFKIFRPLSNIVFYIDFVDFWVPSGSIFDPFPDLFTSFDDTFWHLDFTWFVQCLLKDFDSILYILDDFLE